MKTLALFMLALASAGLLRAQDIKSFGFTFNHPALSVKDVDRSADFYKRVMRLQEITNDPWQETNSTCRP
jgi:lactoylglutathione lyase